MIPDPPPKVWVVAHEKRHLDLEIPRSSDFDVREVVVSGPPGLRFHAREGVTGRYLTVEPIPGGRHRCRILVPRGSRWRIEVVNGDQAGEVVAWLEGECT